MRNDKQTVQPASAGSLVPSLVKDIPIAAQAAVRKPADDDDELDRIMRDVGKDIQDIGKKKPKHHWLSHDKKTKADAKFSARPIDQIRPIPAAPAPAPSQTAKPAPPAPNAATKPAAIKKPKPPKTSRAPIGAIMMAFIITGVLAAAAYYAYK